MLDRSNEIPPRDDVRTQDIYVLGTPAHRLSCGKEDNCRKQEVVIADAAGKTLLDTTSEGPWFLAKLPVGKYQIVATFAGKAEKRTIAVGAEKLKTIDFRWSFE